MNPDFLKGETWGFPGLPVEHIETHAAHVLLCGDRAFKIKKDVKLPYLDFSTLALRRAVIERELAINRTFAPAIYLKTIDKAGEPVLVMNRFDGNYVLSEYVKHRALDPALAADLASCIADSHRTSPAMTTAGSEIMAGLGAQLASAFDCSPDIFPPDMTLQFDRLHGGLRRRLERLLDLRAEQGLVRRCHGDLHCGNIVIIDGKPVLFDAIEFSEKIATVDVLYDLAFLLMDLLRLHQPQAANIALNRYLHLRRQEEDLSGLAALPLFLATRAGVRALATADLAHELAFEDSADERREAFRHFTACIDFLKPKPPQLVCIGGLSGTGKTTLAARLAPAIGAPPGAIHVRSDVERKVLAGVAETHRLSAQDYSRENAKKTYGAVLQRAGRALEAGASVIADAVFASKLEREAAERVATAHGARFSGLWLNAPLEECKARVALRKGDASDATPEVVEAQAGFDIGHMTWSIVNASGDADKVAANASALLES